MIEALWVFEVPMSLPIDARAARRRSSSARARRCARAKAVGEEYEGVEVATATVRARRAGRGDRRRGPAPRRGGDRAGRRGVPVRRIGGRLVTTVLDLMLAQYGVSRPGMPGTWPVDYDDPSTPATPAWQEEITSVPAEQVIRLAREWAQNAIDTTGRGMIAMGAGHQPLVPLRPDLPHVLQSSRCCAAARG